MSLDAAQLQQALIILIFMIGSLSLHEWGHAWTADRLGDDTPRAYGRVTLNPIAHIDPIGTILIPMLGILGFFGGFGVIGWAKPVPINPSNYARRNRDQALVTIAGPFMNVLIGIATVFVLAFCARFTPGATLLIEYLYNWLLPLNVLLIVFNLLPVPPLDGSKFLMYWFGMSEEAYYSFARWGWILLLVLINIGPFREFFGMLRDYAQIPFNFLLWVLLGMPGQPA